MERYGQMGFCNLWVHWARHWGGVHHDCLGGVRRGMMGIQHGVGAKLHFFCRMSCTNILHVEFDRQGIPSGDLYARATLPLPKHPPVFRTNWPFTRFQYATCWSEWIFGVPKSQSVGYYSLYSFDVAVCRGWGFEEKLPIVPTCTGATHSLSLDISTATLGVDIGRILSHQEAPSAFCSWFYDIGTIV